MDTKIVEVRTSQTVVLFIDDKTQTDTVTTFLSSSFIPDEIICKFALFLTDNGAGPLLVNSTICPGFSIPVFDTRLNDAGGDPIFRIMSYSRVNIAYKVTQPIYGNYPFKFVPIGGGSLGTPGAVYCALVLEFVKYKSVEPQKIY